MIQEQYVSYKVAKLLHENGFEINPDLDYWKIGPDGTMYFMSSIGTYTDNPNNQYAYYRPADSYPAPTQQMTMRWLREEHNIFIEPCFYKGGCGWQILDENMELIAEETGFSNSYEEAIESAIKYCLTTLILVTIYLLATKWLKLQHDMVSNILGLSLMLILSIYDFLRELKKFEDSNSLKLYSDYDTRR